MTVKISALPAGTAPTGQELIAAVQSSTTVKLSLSSVTRTFLTANANYYVDNTTGSDSNPGTIGSPFQTLQYAWDHLSTTLDLQSYTLTINVAASVTAYTLVMRTGFIGGTTVFITGAGSATTTINDLQIGVDGALASQVSFDQNAMIWVNGFSLNATVATGINIQQVCSDSILGPDIILGAGTQFNHIFLSGSDTIMHARGYTATTSVPNGGHLLCTGGAVFDDRTLSSTHITFSSCLVFTSCAAGFFDGIYVVTDLGHVSVNRTLVTGGLSSTIYGQQFYVDNGGVFSHVFPLLGSIEGVLGINGFWYENFDYRIATPSTGDTVSMSNLGRRQIINPASSLASLTINLPWTNPSDSRLYSGFQVEIATTQRIDALTVTSTSGQTATGAPTTLSSNGTFSLIYDYGSSNWFLIG